MTKAKSASELPEPTACVRFVPGRPDLTPVFDDVGRHCAAAKVSRVGVVACGPSSLVSCAWDEGSMRSLQLGKRAGQSWQWDVHIERFDF